MQQITGVPRVALVQLPWASALVPSLGLHAIEEHLTRAGVAEVDVHYPNLDFYELLPPEFSDGLLMEYFWENPCLFWLGDGIFAPHAYDNPDYGALARSRFNDYINLLTTEHRPSEHNESLHRLIAWSAGNRGALAEVQDEVIPKFMDALARKLCDGYDIIGLGAFFNQTFACLTLARYLRNRGSEALILLGGAGINESAAPALLRTFESFDGVLAGDGEDALEGVCRVMSGDVSEAAASSVGMFNWQNNQRVANLGVIDLRVSESNPLPSLQPQPGPKASRLPVQSGVGYGKFLASRKKTRFADYGVQVPFEISRGCYWVSRSKCTFCGIADDFPMMAKTPHVAVPEIVSLAETLDADCLVCADTALPKNHIRTTIRELSTLLDPSVRRRAYFFEVRVNMPKDDFRAFSRLGCAVLQPGIESFSTPLLAHMRKGTTGLQNVQFLRWCRIYGVFPVYNLLTGFPNEDPSWYTGLYSLMAKLVHLPPPRTITDIMLLRNSPLLREGDDSLGQVAPWDEYHMLYPAVSSEDLHDLAYYFKGEFVDAAGDPIQLRPDLYHLFLEWREKDLKHEAFLWRRRADDGSVSVFDGRTDIAHELSLTRSTGDVLDALDEIGSVAQIADRVERHCGHRPSIESLEDVLSGLVSQGLAMSEDDKFLDLTIPIAN